MINKKHKDRLFRKILGNEKNKENLLELYNALNNTEYSNVDDLEITTIDDAIYMGMKNDLSFLLDSTMSLYEQQSTFNPNMPLRGLMYFSKLYSKYITVNHYNIFSSKLMKIPTPQYYVFYNGEEEYPDRMELRLSDAFQVKKDEGFEWTAVMLNINYGKNKKLMKDCKILRDYAILVNKIRNYQKVEADMESAVIRAVDECIAENILAEFLLENKAEVVEMCLTEYNEEKTMAMFREEFREEGIRVAIEVAKEYGATKEEVVEKIKEKFSLSEEEARGNVEKYYI